MWSSCVSKSTFNYEVESQRTCCCELQAPYMPLLGTIAYLTRARIDIVVFICAFQRVTHKPQVHRARKLRKLLTWMQQDLRKQVIEEDCSDKKAFLSASIAPSYSRSLFIRTAS